MKTFVPSHGARIYLMATNSQNTVILLTAACWVVLFQRVGTGAVVSRLLESCTKGKEKYQGNFIQSKAKCNSNMLSRVDSGPHKWGNSGAFLLCGLKRQKSFIAKGDSTGGGAVSVLIDKLGLNMCPFPQCIQFWWYVLSVIGPKYEIISMRLFIKVHLEDTCAWMQYWFRWAWPVFCSSSIYFKIRLGRNGRCQEVTNGSKLFLLFKAGICAAWYREASTLPTGC